MKKVDNIPINDFLQRVWELSLNITADSVLLPERLPRIRYRDHAAYTFGAP